MQDSHLRDRILFIALVAALAIANAVLFATGRLEANWTGFGIMIAAGITVSMYSFLYKDNVLFKLVEHIYIGVAGGYVTTVYWYNIFWPELIRPIFLPDPGEARNWLRLVPLILGITLLLRVSRRFGWMSRISFAFIMGFYAGISIPNYIQSFLIEQLHYTMLPLFVAEDQTALLLEIGFAVSFLAYIVADWLFLAPLNKVWVNFLCLVPAMAFLFPGIFMHIPGVSRIVVLFGVLSVLFYFFFSVEQKGPVAAASRVGIYFIMVSFGASFGYTIMARMSLLVGRLEFLLSDWLGVLQ